MSEVRMDAEGRARVIAWRCGYLLDRDARGIRIISPTNGSTTGRVPSFEDIPDAFAVGKLDSQFRLGREVRA